MTQPIGISDGIRVWGGGCATYSDRPFVRVAHWSRLLLVAKASCVPVDNRTMYAETLSKKTYDFR